MTLNRTIPARILRVNHGGERGAIRIYTAQVAAAKVRCPDLVPFLEGALSHEREHLAAFGALMPSRAAKPCGAMWIWTAGGAVLGVVTGVLGRNAILACTEAVERTVHRHRHDQLRYLRGRDAEMAAVVETVQRQELEHLEEATRRGSGGIIGKLFDPIISAAAETLIFISTRGDSFRLARELAG